MGMLYEDAIPAFELPEIPLPGHKLHLNHKCYKNYVNKFSIGNDVYYIRFTVPVFKKGTDTPNVHSTAISDVGIYKAGGLLLTPISSPGNLNLPFVDNKVIRLFASVNENDVSKVVDGQELAPRRDNPSKKDKATNDYYKYAEIEFGEISAEDIDAVKDSLPDSIDLRGATHMADVESLWHTYRHHALDTFRDVKMYNNKEQVGITYDDIRMIPDIILNRDEIIAEKFGGKWSLKYTKKYGDIAYTYIEEIGRIRDTGNRNVKLKTSWLKKENTGVEYDLNSSQPQPSGGSRYSRTAEILPLETYIKQNFKDEAKNIVAKGLQSDNTMQTPTKAITKLMPAQWVCGAVEVV